MKKIVILSALSLLMSACVSTKTQVVVNGQEYAMSRTAAERVVDFGLERDIIKYVEMIDGVKDGNHRVAVNAFRGDVLLTGEVPTQAVKDELERVVSSIRETRSVYNYLKVSSTPKSQSSTLHEQYLKGKIDSKLLLKQSQNISPSQYLVVVRDNFAYIMGTMTIAQQTELIDTIRSVDGILSVSLVNSLVKVDFSGLTPQVSNMPGDLSKVNAHNRLIPIEAPKPQNSTNQNQSNNQNTATPTQSGTTTSANPFPILDPKTGKPIASTQNTPNQKTAVTNQPNNQASSQTNAQTGVQTNQNQAVVANTTSSSAQPVLTDNVAVFPNTKHTQYYPTTPPQATSAPQPPQTPTEQKVAQNSTTPPQYTGGVPLINPANSTTINSSQYPYNPYTPPTSGQTAPSSYVLLYGTQNMP